MATGNDILEVLKTVAAPITREELVAKLGDKANKNLRLPELIASGEVTTVREGEIVKYKLA